jgi:hypothetical protein
MSPNEYPGKEQSLSASLIEEQVDILFSEISLALRWKRPSILIVVCSSQVMRKKAQDILKKSLNDINQDVINFEVSAQNFDIPLNLAQHPERNNAVFYVSKINRGGGGDKSNAFRAINIRRELLVDYPTRVVFWLTKAEAKSLPRLAPDFWAFRHGVVEI